MTLPTNSVSFQAENARSWLVRFWELPGKWVGIAFPFGFVLWILFYFDHNVSVSLLSSGPRPLSLYPLVRLPAPILSSPSQLSPCLVSWMRNVIAHAKANATVVDRSRIRVPTTETTWIPLGFLLAWLRSIRVWYSRTSSFERYAISHPIYRTDN